MENLTERKRQIELHSPEGIRECFKKGISANEPCKGRPLFYEILGEYTRTPGFKDCVRLFIEYGLEFENKALLGVMADYPEFLDALLAVRPEEAGHLDSCNLSAPQ